VTDRSPSGCPFCFSEQPYDFNKELETIDPENRERPREMDMNTITIVSEIGRGSFGTVYKALLDDTKTFGLASFLVAVKELRPGATAMDKDFLLHECVTHGEGELLEERLIVLLFFHGCQGCYHGQHEPSKHHTADWRRNCDRAVPNRAPVL
jgi:serine/threonine protein kinase